MTSLQIKGMTCGHCVHSVTEALREVAGVEAVKVTLNPGWAEVQGKVAAQDLIKAVEAEGYGATVETVATDAQR